MKAARLHSYGDGELRLDEIEEPRASAPDDVVVRIGGAGLCRTDLHIVEGRFSETIGPRLPYVLGHENAGWVYEVGSAVKNVEP
jgi:NAD+-dependent secondary alcohol dehydrogenase Adh1